jgi:hypothetical protein
MQLSLGLFLLGLVRFAVALEDPGLPTIVAGYDRWTQVAKVSDTGGPHAGQGKVVYANPKAAAAWKARTVLPVGSVVVKTAGSGVAPTLVEIMNKTKAGWQYEEYTPKNGKYTLLATGNLCSSCHGGVKVKDFLFTR